MRIDYPRAGKTGVRRLLPSWRQWLAVLFGGLLTGVVLAVAGFAAAYALVEIPSVNETARAQTTVLYYADGETELGRLGTANRTSVAIGAVPDHVQKAVLSAEDRDFYEHGGFDPLGIARAAWNNLRGGATQGGSTITQQLAKNLYLTQERTFDRKARELVLSMKLENTLSKDQILEDYLNTIYFGRGAYGIQAASQAYFAKDVGQLTVAEGAVLASIIRSPGGYAPEDQLERLQAPLGVRPRRHGGEGLARPGRARRRAVPGDRRAPPGGQARRPDRLPGRDGAPRARPARLRRGPAQRGRAAGHHDLRRRRCRPRPSRRSPSSARPRRPRACGSGWSPSSPAPATSARCSAATTTRPASSTTPPSRRRRPARPSSRSRSPPGWSPAST